VHSRTGHGLVFINTGPGWLYHLRNLQYGLGWPLLTLALAASARAARTRNHGGWAILAFLFPYYALLSMAQVRFGRYLVPMLPGIALLTADLIRESAEATRTMSRRRSSSAEWIAGATLFGTAVRAAAFAGLFAGVDPRDAAGTWLRAHSLG